MKQVKTCCIIAPWVSRESNPSTFLRGPYEPSILGPMTASAQASCESHLPKTDNTAQSGSRGREPGRLLCRARGRLASGGSLPIAFPATIPPSALPKSRFPACPYLPPAAHSRQLTALVVPILGA